MWLKVLGLVCVGVFVGAAIVEAQQFRKRGKGDSDSSDSDSSSDGDSDKATASTDDAELVHEER